MSTGKARAFIAIVHKGLRCIDEATVFEDVDDPMALNGAKENWCNGLVEVQQLMTKGDEESIELILKKLKDD